MNEVIPIRTPYDKRDHLQEIKHRGYGKYLYLLDIDSRCDEEAGLRIFMETNGKRSLAYADFKNDLEEIKIWKLEPMINDATALGIPAYVSVLYRDPVICYYIIPLNDICKKMLSSRFLSEFNYVRFLYFLRGMEIPETEIKSLCKIIPENLPLPNLK